MRVRSAAALLALVVAAAGAVHAQPLATTTEDFRLPGTQPLTLTHEIATPDQCTRCHADYGRPDVEPFRNWQGSMMAQSGRDPMTWAALAIANQDAPGAGETCLRCHLPKGWLEGRSAPPDGTAMTAADREGVQCGVCHRLVDPVAHAGNPPEDAAILAALADPVPAPGGAMMVIDPEDRLRGPFDVIADNGNDPHLSDGRSTLISPHHAESEVCGTCHNLRNPVFTKNDATGEWELGPLDQRSSDPTKGFPEQSTYDEWAASAFAQGAIAGTPFGGNLDAVSTCQDCHMPDVTGEDADLAVTRDDLPLHTFAGANTFVPRVLPFHPVFGAEVDAEALDEGIAASIDNLRRAAQLSGQIEDGVLTVRVTNLTGHKLPTGYPEARRMWLHVRAFDKKREIQFETGRYRFEDATLPGHVHEGDAGHDPDLIVFEAEQGISDDVAAVVGLPPGRSFHLALNNVRLKDNRIPPRGFTNAGFAAIDAEPVGAVYEDGQYWADAQYPVGDKAVRAEVTLYYQTTTREYIEFLRDTDVTTAAGSIVFDLWDEHGRSEPVVMARLGVGPDSEANRCRKSVSRAMKKYRTRYLKEWSRCDATETRGGVCDTEKRDAKLAKALTQLEEKLGGAKDKACQLGGVTPASLGHHGGCPAPCGHVTLVDARSLGQCAQCLVEDLGDAAITAAYGAPPPALPDTASSSEQRCQADLDRAATGLASQWSSALERCRRNQALGKGGAPPDCADDPKVQKALAKSSAQVARCASFSGLEGCAEAGDAGAVAACIESAVGPAAAGYAEVVYP